MRRSLAVLGTLFAALLVMLGAAPANADLDDFSYDSWDVHYELSLDANGRAVAEVTETLVARFPDFNQNKGIVRALPMRYERAPAAPENVSVTNAAGERVPFEIEDDSQFRSILIGGNDFVHGVQSYIISYTLHDVVLAASETKVDEFYWDILPLERRQPIDRFTATIAFSPALAEHLTGARSCYIGAAYATQACEISEGEDEGATLTIPAMAVPGGSGVTVAIAFEPGTAVQPPERMPSFELDTLPALLGGIAAATGVSGVVAVVRMRRKRRTFRGTIVAQYDVPPYLPPLIAGPIVVAQGSPVGAEFVHLAVNGVMRIEEAFADGKSGTGKPRMRFRLRDPQRAFDPLDQRMTGEIFSSLAAGETFELPKRSTKFAEQMQRVQAVGAAEGVNRGYFVRERSRTAALLSLGALLVIAPVVVLLFVGSSREPGPGTFFSAMFIGVVALCALAGLISHKVYTPLGAEIREYLLGVREFIRVAEADRLQMLQSYSGAERREDGTVNVVHLYEKLLPYAMLFGLEKEWGKVLQVQYEQERITAPVWYPGIALANSNLGDGLQAFARTLSSSASYSSSSSGGSSGGGFSGGGGGGGFSGGR